MDINEELKNDKEFMLKAIAENSLNIEYVGEELKNNEEFMLQVIEIDTLCFKYASDKLKNDKDFMLKTIERNCLCILFASDELKNDRDFMLKAIEKNGFCISWASEELRNDEGFMLNAVEECSLCFECKGKELEDNTDFSMKSILKDTYYSMENREELRNNKDLVLKTLEIGILCFEYVSEELKNDEDFMLQAIEKNPLSIEFTSEELRNNKKFMLQAIEKCSLCVAHASDELLHDKEFMLKAIAESNECLAYASEELKSNEEFILQVIYLNSFNILFINNKLRKNKEFMLQAIKKDCLCINEASEELRNDEDFMLKALKKDDRSLEYSSDRLNNNHKIERVNDMPGIPITAKEREIKLLEYNDMDISNREEEIYNKKETASYFARMDTDIDYKGRKYYQKFYISKDTVKEIEERGVLNIYGNYITPLELRNMNKSGLITIEEKEKGVYKEYEDGTILIHWTAPLSNLYYDNENNPLKINEYSYNTMLKRKFSFNPFRFYNSYIAENEFYKDGTVDEFLLKVLLDKKESNKLSDIIYTIQENQNKIIRSDETKSFIIQGCAGSGKTMILLHRLSYLKFNNKLPNYDKIKIITPNPLFGDFIKSLTEDLSIEEIEQMTISDYYLLLNKSYLNRYNKIEQIDNKFYAKQKIKFNNQFNVENMLDEYLILNNKAFVIYSDKFFNIIEEEYNQIVNIINEKIKKSDLDIDEKYSDNKTYYEQVIKNIDTEIKKLKKIVDDNSLIIFDIKDQIDNTEKLRATLETKKNRILQEIQNTYQECEDLRKKKTIKLNKGKIIFKDIRNNYTTKQYDGLIELKIKDINVLKESEIEIEEKIKENKLKYSNAISKLENYQNYNTILNDKINKYNNVKSEILEKVYFTIDIYDTIQSKIREKYNIMISKNQYMKIDLLILLYINYIHIGKIINGDSLLCVDEAQDYSLIEYEILNMVNKNIVMNLYGDINQSIYIEGINNWEDLKDKLKCDFYILKENYRNSSEITKYCNEKFNYDILEMGLSVKDVAIIRKENINEIINKKIKEKKSIAVLSKEDLKEKINNELVSYCDVKSAKGIEYNTVIVNDKEMSENEKYIAYTRALSELYIVTDEE